MPAAFDTLPRSLRDRARTERLVDGAVPALLAHPDWASPAPAVFWMHGRTANKELDPGRYNRWLRAGIAAISIDLPGHGERADERLQSHKGAPTVVSRAVGEIDRVLSAVHERHPGMFDAGRLAIGGMSMGGMIALRRLCEPHPFRCAAVEGTTGDLLRLYFPGPGDPSGPWPVDHDRGEIERLSPSEHLAGFVPIPLLALHSEADQMVPFVGQTGFIERLRAHYRSQGADPEAVELVTWTETGAPFEHVGFGQHASEAKNIQTAFLERHLLGEPAEGNATR